jgi:hypothetical protein
MHILIHKSTYRDEASMGNLLYPHIHSVYYYYQTFI